METLQKVVAIGGTTASGKSSLAVTLAKKFNGEVVNCDSRQIYRHLDIGTAKEKIDGYDDKGLAIINGVQHHLIDIVEPSEDYTLADFQREAFLAISDIHKRQKLPILAGGTGLYLDAVIYNYDLKEELADNKRAELQGLSLEQLQEELRETNSKSFNGMTPSDRKNPHRLIRALERTASGEEKPYSQNPLKYHILYLVLDCARDDLSKKISDRVEKMFSLGLLEENKSLRSSGLTSKNIALKTIGYQEFDAYFAGEMSLDEVKEEIVLHTIQYAKRQRSWFRRNEEAKWIKSEAEATQIVANFINR